MGVLVTGGAGFIGSHMVHRLLTLAEKVVVYDNFSSGRRWHLSDCQGNQRLRIVEADMRDLPTLTDAIAGCDTVIHLASNPDIAKAISQPDVDFWQGTYLTHNVLDAMRAKGVKKILYASGSGVYGDAGHISAAEDYSPMLPTSTYGASKLAGEALICAYCYMFGIIGRAFRFANVVGPRQTHGVAYDFVRRLLRDPHHLRVLGNGQQSKSYVHVDDVTNAMLLINDQGGDGYDCFNVATEDYVTVREIADLVTTKLALADVKYEFTGGDRGWKGDVPVVRFNTRKIRARGWRNQFTSAEALQDSVDSMIADARQGRFEDST